MPDDQDRDKTPPAPQPDREDLLSPARSLRESAGRRDSQRVGDSGPLANPEVSFPGEADAEEPEETAG
jgi:hypothetical protein